MSNRSRAILYSTVIFFAGIVAGALLIHLRDHSLAPPQDSAPRAASWQEADRTYHIEQIKKELQLTEVQTRQMEAILDTTMGQYHDLRTFSHHIRGEGITSIRAMLNEKQRQRFDQIIRGIASPMEQQKGQQRSR